MLKEKYLDDMYPSARHYLLSVPDESQIRAARCAMTSNAQMNGESASSGVESMNRANLPVRKKTAVDALNAMLVLLKGDSDRFKKYKKQAWERTQLLTPRGMIEMEEAYKDVNQREYRLDVTEVENGHVAKVSKTNANAKQFVVYPQGRDPRIMFWIVHVWGTSNRRYPMPSYCCFGEIERDTRINKGEHDASVVDYIAMAQSIPDRGHYEK